MLIAVILLGIGQILAILAVPLLIRRIIDVKQRELEMQARNLLADWLNPPEPDKLSKAGVLLQKAGELIGFAAARSIMASIAADASHATRAANTIVDAVETSRNPIQAMLGGGKRGKAGSIQALMEIIGPMLKGSGGSGAPPQGGNGSRPNQQSFSL